MRARGEAGGDEAPTPVRCLRTPPASLGSVLQSPLRAPVPGWGEVAAAEGPGGGGRECGCGGASIGCGARAGRGGQPCPAAVAPQGRFCRYFSPARGRPVCSAVPSAAEQVGKGGLKAVGKRHRERIAW